VQHETEAGGSVRVANEVIASIAAMAAMEVEGVAGMDEHGARHFGDRVRRQSVHRGVRIHVDTNRSIHVELFLTVDGNASIPELADRVQANVVEAVERMLGLEVAAVDVFISNVVFPAGI
jgi:uncharacterized alkaline shock family protein YloU